jgi:hypothetical protein
MSNSFHGVIPLSSNTRTITLFISNNRVEEIDLPDITGCYMVELHILDILFKLRAGGTLPIPVFVFEWKCSGNYRSSDGHTRIYIPVSNPSVSLYSGGFQQYPYNILRKEGKYLRDATPKLFFTLRDTDNNILDTEFIHARLLLTVTMDIKEERNDKFLSQSLTE